jgi:hypothetical protein
MELIIVSLSFTGRLKAFERVPALRRTFSVSNLTIYSFWVTTSKGEVSKKSGKAGGIFVRSTESLGWLVEHEA